VQVVEELSGDALLQLKRQAAARAGLLIDLSLDADVTDEKELEAANLDLLKVGCVCCICTIESRFRVQGLLRHWLVQSVPGAASSACLKPV